MRPGKEDTAEKYTASLCQKSAVLRDRQQRLKKVQSGTVLRAWNLLHHLFEVARREWGFPVDNPTHIARRPKPPIPRDRRLHDGELEALDAECDATRTPWLKPLIYLAIDTAMRKGELLLMKWSDVNLTDGHIFIPAVNTKTSKARTVPLSSRARENLESLLPPELKHDTTPPMAHPPPQRGGCPRATMCGGQ